MALAVNESGRFEIDYGLGCTGSDQCRWTDIKTCLDGCGVLDGCNNVDYGNILLPRDGTKAGNQAALAFNIIGLLLLTVAIIIIFIKSIQEKIGKYIIIIVGLSAFCALIAIIAMAAGNAPENECWNVPTTDTDVPYETSADVGITFYFQIAVFVLLIFATILIHKEHGYGAAGGTTNWLW